MKGKLLFVAGVTAGYIVGARAGRPAYDAIVGGVRRVSHDPHVHDAAERAKAFGESKAPAVTAAVVGAGSAVTGAATAASEAGDPPAAAPATGAVPGGADEAATPTATD